MLLIDGNRKHKLWHILNNIVDISGNNFRYHPNMEYIRSNIAAHQLYNRENPKALFLRLHFNIKGGYFCIQYVLQRAKVTG